MYNLDGKNLEKVAGGSMISGVNDGSIHLRDEGYHASFKDIINVLNNHRNLDKPTSPTSSISVRDDAILQWIERNFRTDEYREHKAEIRNSLSDGGKQALDKFKEEVIKNL